MNKKLIEYILRLESSQNPIHCGITFVLKTLKYCQAFSPFQYI